MITKHDLDKLASFQTGGYFVTSLYLHVDGKKLRKRDYEIKLKAMIRERKMEMGGLGLNDETLNSIMNDFDRMIQYISFEFDGKGAKSLAIFSCSALDLWKVFPLPDALHPRLVISKQPYLRPLNALLAEHRHYLVIMVSRDKARLFDYYMGELQEFSKILDEVPGQIKMAGWYGLEERRIERHIEDHVHRHFKHVADGVFQYFQSQIVDHVILGGRSELLPDFERYLHSTIKERVVKRLKIDIDAPDSDLLAAIRKTITDFEVEEQKRMVEKLFNELRPDGLGITGLKATLKALWHGQVATLFVTEDYSRPGYYCPNCWAMSDNEEICANDQTPMKPSHDIIEDAIETAIFQNSEVIRVKDSTILSGKHEHLGALLRFKI